VRDLYASPSTIPEEFLLWFHHLSWDYKTRSGNTLWNELVLRYYQGAEDVSNMLQVWNSLERLMDPQQFKQVQMALDIQVKEALWWRNACVLYFQHFSQRELPSGLIPPKGQLEDYQAMKFPYAPGRGG